jgi:hypothetical protein
VTAELIAAGFTGERTAIPHEPYLPARFAIGATLAQMKTRKRQAQNEEKE